MDDFAELRGGHPPRDIYSELQGIEQRGRRLRHERKSWLRRLFRPGPASEGQGVPTRSA